MSKRLSKYYKVLKPFPGNPYHSGDCLPRGMRQGSWRINYRPKTRNKQIKVVMYTL